MMAGFCFGALCANAQANADSLTSYIIKAREFTSGRNYRMAADSYEKALRFCQPCEAVHVEFARFQFSYGTPMQGNQQVDAVLAKDSMNMDALQLRVDQSIQFRQWNDVLLYGRRLRRVKSVDSVDVAIATALYYKEEYKEAIKLLEPIVGKQPTAPAALLLGRCYYEESGDFRKAAGAFQLAVQADPYMSKAWMEYGIALSNTNQPAKALDCLNKAAELGEPQVATFLDNKVRVLTQLDRWQDAIAVCDQAIEKYPKEASFWALAGYASIRLRDFNKALKYCPKAFELDNEDYTSQYLWGQALANTGDKEKGNELMNAALAKDPSLRNRRF